MPDVKNKDLATLYTSLPLIPDADIGINSSSEDQITSIEAWGKNV